MDLKQEFIRIVNENISREGISDLMHWLELSDFYTSPASTHHHEAFEGGLLLHSLNVYSQLKKLCNWYKCWVSDESLAIVSLFHDFCKIGCYKTDMRWRKNEQNQWEQYATYKFEEDFAYGGHGSKSVYLVQNFMKLTPEEASAINCHMGAWDLSNYSNPGAVFERNLLAWLLHVADEAATYINETKEEEDVTT